MPEGVWEDARIGVALRGRHAGRIIVPVLADTGEWMGWVGRAWGKSTLPYLYSRGMRRGELLYNQSSMLVDTDEPVAVVEGVFDCYPTWPDSAAMLGKPSTPSRPSPGQFEALLASRRPLAVVLDGDSWMQGKALSMRLRAHGQRAGFVRLPPQRDPDEVPVEWLRSEMRRCVG